MLRAAYMGEALGFGYADPRKRVIIPEHAYRLGLIIGGQPERAEALLNDQDVDGGTPPRFLWLPTEDAAITADDVTFSPRVIKEATRGAAKSGAVIVPERIRREIRENYAARQQGDRYALASHRMFTQLKVTYALALLEDRQVMNLEDWDLAALVMTKSDITRQSALDAITKAKAAHNRAQGSLPASVRWSSPMWWTEARPSESADYY